MENEKPEEPLPTKWILLDISIITTRRK